MASVSVELRSSAIKSQLLRVIVVVVKVVLLFMDGTVVPEQASHHTIHRLDHIIHGRSFPTSAFRLANTSHDRLKYLLMARHTIPTPESYAKDTVNTRCESRRAISVARLKETTRDSGEYNQKLRTESDSSAHDHSSFTILFHLQAHFVYL